MSDFRLKSTFEPIATTVRSAYDESLHFGVVVGLSADGSVAFSVGDVYAPIYPRSCMKAIQATAMVRHGLKLPPRLLALVCSSHDGCGYHIEAATEILAGAGLAPDALGNTWDLPLNVDEAHSVLRRGGDKNAIQMNCSGKHSGMMATCVVNGWPTESYLQRDHPLQQAINAVVTELTGGEAAAHIGVDGCGAPAHAISLIGLAKAYRYIATASESVDPAAAAVAAAMRAHPEMVGGPTRDVTLIMQGVPGAVSKDGAEGVFVVAMGDGRVAAMKVADGANRARGPVMAAALRALGVDTSGVSPKAFHSPVFGHGAAVGEVTVVGKLADIAAAAAAK